MPQDSRSAAQQPFKAAFVVNASRSREQTREGGIEVPEEGLLLPEWKGEARDKPRRAKEILVCGIASADRWCAVRTDLNYEQRDASR